MSRGYPDGGGSSLDSTPTEALQPLPCRLKAGETHAGVTKARGPGAGQLSRSAIKCHLERAEGLGADSDSHQGEGERKESRGRRRRKRGRWIWKETEKNRKGRGKWMAVGKLSVSQEPRGQIYRTKGHLRAGPCHRPKGLKGSGGKNKPTLMNLLHS